MPADLRRLTLRKVEVRSSRFNQDLKEMVDIGHLFESQCMPHRGLIFRAKQGFLWRNETCLAQLEKGIIHQDHALLLTCLDDTRKHESLSFSNEVSDGWIVHQNFHGETAAGVVRARDKLLTDDPAQRLADHDPNLFALVVGEDVQHSIEGSRCVAGVKRAQDQVAGLGRCDRERYRLEVTHLPDHDHVGILAQRAPQRRTE